MATLKNSVIVGLVNLGLLYTTEHDVPVKDAYKAYAFRHAIEKTHKAVEEKRLGLVASAGIKDGQQFEQRLKELRGLAAPSKEQEAELAGMEKKLKTFDDLYKELLEDTSEVEGVKAMSYESFHALAKENKAVSIPVEVEGKMTSRVADPFRVFERDLEGILWIAPED